jgi:UDP-N-acetylmuramoyl-L-alanyl-D-glutamate--2,6-diaminopimelate ligase
MKLKKLFKDLPVDIKGSKEIEVTGICANSKLVAPGNLFIAKKGLTNHGARFVPEAIAAGAVAILSDIYDPFLQENVVQIIHPDVSSIEAKIAASYYQHPVDKLFLVGITGTNGKTTTSYLVKHLLEAFQMPCGFIGTTEWIVGKNHLPSLYTTPDLLMNYKLFHEMVLSGCKAAVTEVSSQALDQERVREIEYDVAVFTNLTQDHLDYHKTLENYAAAKAKLFESLGQEPVSKSFPKAAVVNLDSPWAQVFLRESKVKTLTYGIESKADLFAEEIALTPDGIQFTAHYQGKKARFHSKLIGRFNVYNVLAAIGVCLTQGHELGSLPDLVKTFSHVRGRLERVENLSGLNIFVDYAHTDDALHNVLKTLKEIKKGKVITVFGCGGNRDQGKRPKMGKIAELLSDQCIITNDNPRNEEPEKIIQEILSGFYDPTSARVFPDRKEAIRQAILSASKDDIVLIAGKGHETTQIFAHQTLHFDDREVALDALAEQSQ